MINERFTLKTKLWLISHREFEEIICLENKRKLLCVLHSINTLAQCTLSNITGNWSWQDTEKFQLWHKCYQPQTVQAICVNSSKENFSFFHSLWCFIRECRLMQLNSKCKRVEYFYLFSIFLFTYRAKINTFIQKNSWKCDRVAFVKEDAQLCKFRVYISLGGIAMSVTLHLHKILLGNRSEERYEVNYYSNESICVEIQSTKLFGSRIYGYPS